MLTLDPYSENVLFQCDRCRFVGELFTDVVEEEGSFYCWSCLNVINHSGRAVIIRGKEGNYAAS
jgi:hypothetical protein